MKTLFTTLFFFISGLVIAQTKIVYNPLGKKITYNPAGSSFTITSGVKELSYTLNSGATTSAGVFATDGTLVRTLWNNEKRDAAKYSLDDTWDGKNDTGLIVPDGNYQIKVFSNNIQYSWDIVGNTSTNKTGSTVHHSQDVVTGMAFTNNAIYYSVGYNEGAESGFKSNLSTPKQKLHYKPGYGVSILYEWTDGVRVYYAGTGFQADNSTVSGVRGTQYIYATNISNDQDYTFTAGINMGLIFSALTYSAIDTTLSTIYSGDPGNPNIPECSIGGFTGQQSGNYLFVSYFDRNQIHVLNKYNGALVQNITGFINPKSMAVDRDNDNAIWICSGTNTVAKYTINSNGTLSNATLTLSGLVKPLCVATKAGTVAVMDGSTRQQVRMFSNTTGSEGMPVGQLGGYATSSVVAPDKFMFKNTKEFFRTDRNNFIAFDLSGGLWVGDRGNYRVQHFNSSNVFVESIMSIGYHYDVQVEKAYPAKVYANYLQFSVNYSDFSWTLTNNWAYNITDEFDGQAERLRGVTTLSNGHTYAMAAHKFVPSGQSYVAYRWQIVELVANGNIRFTGVQPEFTGGQFDVGFTMNSDGSLLRLSNTVAGSPASWLRYPLTGFDGSNNPVYGSPQTLASIPAVLDYDPITSNGIQPDQITEDSVIGTFNNELSLGTHLGGIKRGSTNWNFLSSPSTKRTYNGDFPKNGYYDVGNAVNYQGSALQAAGNYFACGNHGEGWKRGQIDIVNIYMSNGLLLCQVGLPQGKAQILGEAPAGYTGNAVCTIFRKFTSDKYILASNDEAQHGAIRFFVLTGFDSVKTQTFPITKAGLPAQKALSYTDLMAGLPVEDTLTASTAGWVMNPAPYNYSFYNRWNMTTDYTVYKAGDRSIRLAGYPVVNGKTFTCTRAITSNAYSSWKITGAIGYPEPGEPNFNYFDVLDSNNRVIVRMYSPYIGNINYLKVNSATITSDLADVFFSYTKSQTQPFSMLATGNAITVTYADYPPVVVEVQDPQADITHPAKLRVQFYNDLQRGHALDLENLKFYPGL